MEMPLVCQESLHRMNLCSHKKEQIYSMKFVYLNYTMNNALAFSSGSVRKAVETNKRLCLLCNLLKKNTHSHSNNVWV